MSKHSAITYVSEFAGGFPEIAVPADIDISQLERDGESPFWVTLPIVPDIGAVSGNGLLYDDDLATSIEEQINSKRPGGNFGHLGENERDTAFPHPKAFWVAALRVGQTLWAKCYVPAGEAREHLRNLKAVGGRIATSIFGRGDFEKVSKGVQRLTNFTLESVDFAPPERAALGYAASVGVTELEHEEEINMPNEVTEMAQVSETLRAQIIAEHEKQAGTARQVAELTQARDAAVAELDAMREQNRQRAVVEVRRSIKDRVAELSNWQTTDRNAANDLEALRRTVVEFAESKLGESTDLVEAQRVVDGMWVQFKPLAETLRDKLAGPAAVVSGRVQETGRLKLEDTPETRATAKAKMGIQV